MIVFAIGVLLGRPQAGILVGDADIIAAIEKNPLMRALRVDKITLAALGATLRLHRDPRRALSEVPILAMLTTPIEVLKERADRIALELADQPEVEQAVATDTTVYLGGGSAPTQGIASVAVRLKPRAISAEELASRLRAGQPRVVSRVQGGAVMLELRTVFAQQDRLLVQAIRAALSGLV